jgi:FkbM family methyltransferase
MGNNKSILDHREGVVEWTALGATAGENWINVAERPTQSSFHNRTALTAKKLVDTRRVPITTLDTLIEDLNPPRPFVIKIDTEGSELDVIRGGRTTLESTDAVIVEASVAERFEGGYRFRELAGELFSLGFDLVDIMSLRRTRDGRLNHLDAVFLHVP